MIIFDLMLVWLVITTITLLSGAKIMYNPKYSIHNVKEKDVINIIESYLERKNLKYEVKNDEIYLLDIDNNIYVRSLMEITLDCREIKNTDFCNEIIDEVKMGIKEIKQRYFSIEGMF